MSINLQSSTAAVLYFLSLSLSLISLFLCLTLYAFLSSSFHHFVYHFSVHLICYLCIQHAFCASPCHSVHLLLPLCFPSAPSCSFCVLCFCFLCVSATVSNCLKARCYSTAAPAHNANDENSHPIFSHFQKNRHLRELAALNTVMCVHLHVFACFPACLPLILKSHAEIEPRDIFLLKALVECT